MRRKMSHGGDERSKEESGDDLFPDVPVLFVTHSFVNDDKMDLNSTQPQDSSSAEEEGYTFFRPEERMCRKTRSMSRSQGRRSPIARAATSDFPMSSSAMSTSGISRAVGNASSSEKQ